jgi:hypothetical protein
VGIYAEVGIDYKLIRRPTLTNADQQVPPVGMKNGIKNKYENVNFGNTKSMTMDIAIKKVELIEWLAKLQDKKVIKKVESLKNQSIKSSYEAKLKPMSSKAYKAMLEKSEEDYRQGRVIGQAALEKESEGW